MPKPSGQTARLVSMLSRLESVAPDLYRAARSTVVFYDKRVQYERDLETVKRNNGQLGLRPRKKHT